MDYNPKNIMKKLLITCLLASLALSAQAFDGTFDSLLVGPLNGQDGWTAPTQANVVLDPTGGTTNFSGQVMSLTGNTSASGQSMNSWAVNALAGTPDWSMDAWIAPGIPTDPSELFIRFNSWSSYVAIKWATQGDPTTGILEVPGGSLTGLNIPLSTVFNLDVSYTVSGGVASSVAFAIDGSPVGSISSLSIDVLSGANVEFRSQKVQSYVDNFTIVPEPSTYAALLGLLALGFVAWRRRK